MPMFTLADVSRHIERFKNNRIDWEIKRLVYIGESFVNNARASANFRDITGNLRNSIGYVVLYRGQIEKGTVFDSGIVENKANEIVSQFKPESHRGPILIGFAGMEYAAYVESRGYDVISSSVPWAEELLRELTK